VEIKNGVDDVLHRKHEVISAPLIILKWPVFYCGSLFNILDRSDNFFSLLFL
jgi:hypothetical protein